MLASDFQLTNSAQIGTAVIGTAQIGALQVGTSNIGNSAVTNAFATNIPGTGGSMDVFTDGAGEPIFLWWSVPVAGEVDGSGNYLSTVLTISAGGSTIQSLSQVTDGHVWMGNTVLNFSTSGWQTVTVNVGTYGSLYNGTLSALTIKK
jgi:hypothetical protein